MDVHGRVAVVTGAGNGIGEALAQAVAAARGKVVVADRDAIAGRGLSDDVDWSRAVEVNLMAHVRAAQVLVPAWLERGEGYFISTSPPGRSSPPPRSRTSSSPASTASAS